MIVGDFLNRQSPRIRRRHGDCQIRLAFRQVHNPRQGQHLYLKLGMLRLYIGTDLGQQEIRTAIRRPDPDLPRKARPFCLWLVDGKVQRGLGLRCMITHLLPNLGQGIPLRRFHKQRGAQSVL